MSKESVIKLARELRQKDEIEESQELLLELLEEHADDPLVLYEVGGSYDVLGEEPDAIPYYQQAIEAGLEGDDLQECLICLGSSQRYSGKFEDAVETLEQATQQFPDNNGIRTFLALAQYSDGGEDKAVGMLLDILLKTTKDENILAFANALEYYAENLDEVWE
ncbi:MAG: tetratricopeptide repeat protein [Chloroflexi bacterium]|nr:tetratricopeptide repeat protein [Chloroflexota bacterium]